MNSKKELFDLLKKADRGKNEYLTDLFRNLPEEKRYVFLRRYWYGESLSDIAENAKISETRVKNILAKLRKNLREELKKEGFSL